jgi:hypothetical protein
MPIGNLARSSQESPEPTQRPPVAAGVAAAGAAQSLPTLVAGVFTRLHLSLRLRVLRRLLLPVGPLALAILGGGVFARYATRARWRELCLSLEDAARVTSGQIYELVRYVEQSDPLVVQQVLADLARDATAMAVLGASVGGILTRRIAHGNAEGATPSPRRPALLLSPNR